MIIAQLLRKLETLLLQKCQIYGYLFNMEMNGKVCDLKSNFHKMYITILIFNEIASLNN